MFLLFMNLVAPWQWGARIGARKRIKHPNVKKCTLPVPTPKVPSNNIKSSSIFSVGSSVSESFRSIGRRAGSTLTSQHTSLSRLAVKSRTSLWRIDGNPPHGQLKACSTENNFPHAHVCGRFTGCQPNLKHRASQNSPLGTANPCSAIGRVVSQHDAHCSEMRQLQRHASGVETSVQKASLPEQIDHCGKRPSTHVCTGTSVN